MANPAEFEQFDAFSDPTLLSAPDRAALDALVEAGFDVSAVPAEMATRAGRVHELLSVIDLYPEEPASANLAQRTLDLIGVHETGSGSGVFRFKTRLDPPMEAIPREGLQHPFGGINWRELTTIAASVLIIVSVVWPMLSSAREQARCLSCRSNLLGASLGFSAYASDFGNSLPVMTASAPGGNWLDSRANSANLFGLASLGYVSLSTLRCPNNGWNGAGEQVLDLGNWPSLEATSFSYQNVFTDDRPEWSRCEPIVILADRSPVVDAMHAGEQTVDANSLSLCHGGTGQNALLSDGSGHWLTSAEFAGDNIWLPRDLPATRAGWIRLIGTELPVDRTDSMLIH